jgi:transcription elongation GreA/GreB family factor
VTATKDALKAELLAIVAGALDQLERAQSAAVEGATHEEAKPENDKDTRALEQSYLARGQSMRIDELRTEIAELRATTTKTFADDAPIARGALVEVEEEERGRTSSRRVWIAPAGGGCALDGGRVHVVTPKSPLGKELLGKHDGDDFEIVIGGKTRVVTILSVT